MMENNTLFRKIVGGLKCCINAHGPITKRFIGSASKRIAGNLKYYEAINLNDKQLKHAIIVYLSSYEEQLIARRKHMKFCTRKERFILKAKNKMMVEMLSDLRKILGVTKPY